MGWEVFVVGCVVPADDAFVVFDHCLAVFLECGIVVDVEYVAFGQVGSDFGSEEFDFENEW